ncbi:unnamed protein product [Cuscuta campestris]|uniref:Telomere repeat-binding protein 1-6-like ubiquitin-like domain-containing protein n=1 Tax=Cuscuta campestris TaxID=132261 RepID=A0A484NSX8_9ASTE|nr:unnamed protein product [Cuscuta campestris]
MVLLHKRSDDNGYHAPLIPRSTRSTRKRGFTWRKAEVDKQKCAFDLLATIAGNLLLQEGDNSPPSSTKDNNNEEEQNAQETISEEQCRDRGGCERNFFLSELVAKEQICYDDHEEHETWPSAVTTTSDCSGRLELGSLNRKGFECGKERNDNHRNLKDYPFKKRTLYDDDDDDHKNSMSISEIGHYNEDASSYALTLPTGTSSSSRGEGASFRSNESSRVKLRIKSFRIPELFIEIQENATVGSLKRTVMEAVTTVLGNGLRVGVLLQGKKVRDDTKTLLQSGIRHDDNAVGFTLEPISAQDSTQPRDPRRVKNTTNLIGSGATSAMNDVVGPLVAFPRGNNVGGGGGGGALAVAAPPSPTRKPRGPETAQRRIRRPFTVCEVESLVQAVEKLGTGRWRVVKLRAFDNAKHRTYVDLKVGVPKSYVFHESALL